MNKIEKMYHHEDLSSFLYEKYSQTYPQYFKNMRSVGRSWENIWFGKYIKTSKKIIYCSKIVYKKSEITI
jgi:transposase-like protein